MFKHAAVVVAGLFAFVAPQRGAAVTVENDLYTIRVDAAAGGFTVSAKPSGTAFLTGGTLSGTNGTAKAVDVADKAFGNGTGVELSLIHI